MCNEKKAMNIFHKLQEARCRLQSLNLKKTGQNKFAGYQYFELGDILPAINNINRELGLCTHITFNNEFAKLTVFDSDSADFKSIEFTSPMAKATLKGAHDIQNLGATETYQRRYLYVSAYEIVESDAVDASKGKAPKELLNSGLIPEMIADIEEISTVEELKAYWDEFNEKFVVNKKISDAVTKRKKELTEGE